MVPEGAKWSIGDAVMKKRGSSWRGWVVGFYTTEHTPIGYCVESAYEQGSVQVWPEAALEDWGIGKRHEPPKKQTPEEISAGGHG